MLSKSLSVLLVVYFVSDFSCQPAKFKFSYVICNLQASVAQINDYEHVEGLQGVYKFHTTPKNWRDAKQACADEDASFFYPKNSEEVNAIILFWNLHDNEYCLYVGISDIITEGVYETIDGKSISEVYNNWDFDQPDNYNNEDCVQLRHNGRLNDATCDSRFKFICEKKLSLTQINSTDLHQSDLDEEEVKDTLQTTTETTTDREQQTTEYEQTTKYEQKAEDEQRTNKFFRKDYSYIEAVESFYKIHRVGHPWDEAKRVCALEGATFWHPDNDDEAHAVISFWNATQPHIGWMYVGLSDMMAQRLFVTTDGKTVSEVYKNWLPNQPDNQNGQQHCVIMYINGYLNDYGCTFDYPFICKKTLQSLEWNNQCNMSNLGYTFNKDIRKCYKLHTTPLSWAEAYAVCQREQSHLAVVSNQREAEYLANLTQSTPNPRVKENYQRGIYHVGFHNRFNDGWQTVKGTAVEEATDVWWDSYKPADDRAQCGSMFYTGRLVNTDCGMKSFFICEHDILS